MKKYMGYELGRVMILNLERDDLLLETIELELRKKRNQKCSSDKCNRFPAKGGTSSCGGNGKRAGG